MATRSVQLVCLLICSLAIIKIASAKVNESFKQEKGIDHAYFVEKTIVQNALSKGAVCLDGSPPAYHLDRGFGYGVRNWIILLSATNLHFRGARIFDAVIEDLLARGLKDAKNGSIKVLPKSCTSKMKPELCFFPENIQQDIKTPFFTVMSAFDSYQIC
uniref:Pectin acetylesterase n=1 Tax=Nicotiana tabacum TaxID=4097 RepID=A0A1S4AAM8_TOBAC|nr:PREDICTED: pectin acetylesterase 8-like isoform X3 [Nicotiana tabacum]